MATAESTKPMTVAEAFDCFSHPMVRFARTRVATWSQAEEAVAEAFIAAVAFQAEGTPIRSWQTWLYTAVANACTKITKKHQSVASAERGAVLPVLRGSVTCCRMSPDPGDLAGGAVVLRGCGARGW